MSDNTTDYAYKHSPLC